MVPGNRINIGRDTPHAGVRRPLDTASAFEKRQRRASWPLNVRKSQGHAEHALVQAVVALGLFRTLASDTRDAGEALIVPVMRKGKRIDPVEKLNTIRERSNAQLACLPNHLKGLVASPVRYPVKMSAALKDLAEQVDQHFP